MPRLTLFAKGNIDVRDALHSASVGGIVKWNGINEVVRNRFPGWTVRVRHETWNRSDALLAAGDPPESLARRDHLLGPHPSTAQFSRAVFTTPADVVVLSLQPDATTTLLRHRGEGYLFYPYGAERWPEADRQWIRTECEDVGPLAPHDSAAHLIDVIRRIQERTTTQIVLFNMSSVVPGELVHRHFASLESISTRIRRFNLALIEVATATGASIVDVDAVIAMAGANRLKLDAVHLNPEGHRLVAEETVRILADLGCFEQTEGEVGDASQHRVQDKG